MPDSIFITNSQLSVDETAGVVNETISRTGSLVGDITVTYGITGDTATAGQDFIGGTGTITIPSGVSQVTIPIQIVDDALPEATETFALSLIDATDGTIWAPRTGRVSILDNETPAPPPDPEPSFDPNYNVTTVPLVTGLDQPIRMVFSPLDSNLLYVASKTGVISLANLQTGQASTVLDLSAQVNDYADRGLLDIALHPDFANNPYIYVFAVVDPPETAGNTGAAGPDGIGNRYAQVIRYTADASTGFTTIVPGSAVVLAGGNGQSLADISGGGAQDFTDPQYADAPASDRYINSGATNTVVIDGYKQDYIKVDSSTHAGGHLTFGPDGALYVSTGEGGSFNLADPRAASVQSLDSLAGKILRIDPMTGRGLPDNPFVTNGVSLDSDRAKVFQLGLRNPFSMTFDQQGRLFITDTGWNSFEEIDTGGPGANFGWPWYEGADGGVSRPTPAYRDFSEAADFYAAVANGSITVTAPFRAFSHDSADPGYQMQAITAGEVIISGGAYPSSLQNSFIFADFAGGHVFAVNVNNSSDLKFLYQPSGFYPPIDFVQGPDGRIYYADMVYGEIGSMAITSITTAGSTTIGSGPDVLLLNISEDAYLGDAEYTISVDGVQIGGTLTATASHSGGEHDMVSVLGTWGAGNHTVTLNFLNDAWGGSSDTDRNLYLDSMSYNSVAVAGGSASLPNNGPVDLGFPSVSAPLSTTIGSGANSLVLKISQDAYAGDAQYTITVDGVQIGGTLTASARHGSGLSDTVTVMGDWGVGQHTVSVNFLNDAWGGSGNTDRNLYVDSMSYNGVAVGGGSAFLPNNGAVDIGFPSASAPVDTTIGSGSDSIVLKISQDEYAGSAQYTVSVDGVQVGGTLTASARHGSGQSDTVTVLGSWGNTAHTVTVNFLNDAWGGSSDTDRNLYVDATLYGGVAASGGSVFLPNNGSQTINLSPLQGAVDTTIGTGPDSLVFKISQDAYQGNAQYTISVDGVQIGDTLTASAMHGSGLDDTVTVQGTWGEGVHHITVNFLNDAWGGSGDTDRNLYVDSITLNGNAVAGSAAFLPNNGPTDIGFTVGSGIIYIAEDDTDPVVNDSHVTIIATAGNHSLFIGGSFDTATLTGGTQAVLAFQGNNTITTGAADDSLRFGGENNVIDAGAGNNRVEDSGANNTIILPGPGNGFDDIFGYVLGNGDVLDLRPALAGTDWDGQQATLGNYIHVTMSDADAIISMSTTANGTFTDIAKLNTTGDVDLATVLAHSATS